MGNNRQKELVSFKLLVDKGGIGNSSHILDETFGARATQSKSDKATPKHKIFIQKDKWFIFVLWQIIRRSVAMYGFKKWVWKSGQGSYCTYLIANERFGKVELHPQQCPLYVGSVSFWRGGSLSQKAKKGRGERKISEGRGEKNQNNPEQSISIP